MRIWMRYVELSSHGKRHEDSRHGVTQHFIVLNDLTKPWTSFDPSLFDKWARYVQPMATQY